jgi:hypothetical protein
MAHSYALGLGLFLFLVGSTSEAALSISNIRSLAFGTFAPGKGGAVTMTPDGTRHKSGDVTLISIGGAATSAAFLVSDSEPANATHAYNINLPNDTQITISNGEVTIAVTDFSSEPAYQGRLTDGSQLIRVGATLRVPPRLPPGQYSGTFNVTVVYQ